MLLALDAVAYMLVFTLFFSSPCIVQCSSFIEELLLNCVQPFIETTHSLWVWLAHKLCVFVAHTKYIERVQSADMYPYQSIHTSIFCPHTHQSNWRTINSTTQPEYYPCIVNLTRENNKKKTIDKAVKLRRKSGGEHSVADWAVFSWTLNGRRGFSLCFTFVHFHYNVYIEKCKLLNACCWLRCVPAAHTFSIAFIVLTDMW